MVTVPVIDQPPIATDGERGQRDLGYRHRWVVAALAGGILTAVLSCTLVAS